MDIDVSPILDVHSQTLHFLELPKNWALQKPLAEYNTDIVDKLIAANRIQASKKYNGHRMHILINDNHEVILYNRTNKDQLNGFVPNLSSSIKKLNLPANCLIDGEIYIPRPGKESLDQLQNVITCGDAELGASREKESQPQIALFDVLAFGGKNLILQPYSERQKFLPIGELIHPAEIVPITSRKQGMEIVESNGWEGLVLWDIKAPHKLNINGNTKRGASFKLIKGFDEDFVAIDYKEGSGCGVGMVGTLIVGKYKDGEFVQYGEVGSGLTLEEKKLYTDKSKYPFVVAVKHGGLDPKGRITLPAVTKLHLDKLPREVQTGLTS